VDRFANPFPAAVRGKHLHLKVFLAVLTSPCFFLLHFRANLFEKKQTELLTCEIIVV